MSWMPASKPQEEQKGPPKCFGLSWDQGATDCAGGPNPAFKEEKISPSGERYISHVQPMCGYFQDCGSRFQASKMGSQQLVPVTSLTRAWQGRPVPAPVSSPQPMSGSQPSMQSLQQQFEKMQRDWYQQQQQMMQRGQMQMPMMPMMPQQGYQQMMPVNFEIPQYLTRREYRRPDEGLTRVLGREVLRSVLKSAGHTFANFFDSTAFYEPPPRE